MQICENPNEKIAQKHGHKTIKLPNKSNLISLKEPHTFCSPLLASMHVHMRARDKTYYPQKYLPNRRIVGKFQVKVKNISFVLQLSSFC